MRGLIGETWRILRAHSAPVLFLCAPFVVAISLASAWFNPELGKAPNEGVSIAVDLTSIVIYSWLSGLAVATLQARRSGQDDTSAMSLCAHAFRRLPALVFAGVATTVGVLVGLLLLVVPGLLLAARWLLAVPLVMVERQSGHKALGRSNERVQGSTWPLAGVVAMLFLPILILLVAFSYVSVAEASFTAYFLGDFIVGLACIPIYAALSLVAYDQTAAD